MQSELITINTHNIHNKNVNAINARDLWVFIESKQDFSTWIKNRMIEFQENTDYIKLHKIVEQVSGAKKLIEYHLTIETAKHIAMMERNDKGRQIRQYFIDFEEKVKTQLINLSRKQILQIALEAEEKAEQLQLENQKQQSIINKYIKIDKSKNYTETAKILGLHPQKFITYLKTKYITQNRSPIVGEIKNGRFEIKKTITIENDNNTKHYESYLITPKGFEYFFDKVKKGELDFLKIKNS